MSRARRLLRTQFSALILTACVGSALAEPLPLWEVGVGLGGVSLPDYRGADTRTSRVLPAPYFVYRGERLKADRSGVRAALFGDERTSLDLSLNLSLARTAGDTPARRGMPDLRPTVEIGPAVNVRLWQQGGSGLDLRLPVRAAVTVESSPRHVGWLFAPNLLFHASDLRMLPGWRLGVQGGPLFATRAYHAYTYAVAPEQALPERPAYAARGGYGGLQGTVTLSKRFERVWVGAYLRQDWLRGTAFEDSPLVRRSSGATAGLAFAWIFGTSGRAATSGDTID